MRALLLATRYFVEPANKAEVINYLMRVFKLEAGAAATFYRRLIPSLSPTGIVATDKVRLIVDGAVDRGLINKAVDPETLVDFSFARGL